MAKFNAGQTVQVVAEDYINHTGVVTQVMAGNAGYYVQVNPNPDDDFFRREELSEALEFAEDELREIEAVDVDVNGALDRLEDALDRSRGFRTVTVAASDLQAIVDALKAARNA